MALPCGMVSRHVILACSQGTDKEESHRNTVCTMRRKTVSACSGLRLRIVGSGKEGGEERNGSSQRILSPAQVPVREYGFVVVEFCTSFRRAQKAIPSASRPAPQRRR